MKRLIVVAPLALIGCFASAAVANFDDLSEGFFAPVFTNGGITFKNLDQNLGDGPIDNFTIDQADLSLTGMPGFSGPNVLGFGGWANGGDVGFSRFGSMDFTTGGSASSASVDIFSFFADAGTTITLQGLNGGTVVNSATVSLPATFVIEHTFLSLGTGDYDSFHLFAQSPTNQNSAFVAMDNFTVNSPVPEPASIAAITLGCAALLRRRRK